MSEQKLVEIRIWAQDLDNFVEHVEECFGAPKHDIAPFQVVFRRSLRSMSQAERAIITYHWALVEYKKVEWKMFRKCCRDVGVSRLSTVEFNWKGQRSEAAGIGFVEGALTIIEGHERELRYSAYFNAMRTVVKHVEDKALKSFLQSEVDVIADQY